MSAEVTTKPILKWQREQIVKELLLLQAHISDPTCPCDTEGEFCTRKHLLLIEAYAQETSAIADTDEEKAKLNDLAIEAKRLRAYEEKQLCNEDVELDVDMEDWARSWRKQFEESSIACEIVARQNVIPLNYEGEDKEVAMSSNPGIGEALVTGAGIEAGLVIGKKVLEKKEGNPWTPPRGAVKRDGYYEVDGSYLSKVHGVALSPCEVEHGLAGKLDSCISSVEERNIEAGCSPEELGTKKCPNPYAVCRASISQPVCSAKVESPKV